MTNLLSEKREQNIQGMEAWFIQKGKDMATFLYKVVFTGGKRWKLFNTRGRETKENKKRPSVLV